MWDNIFGVKSTLLLILTKPFTTLNIWIMSPRLRLYTRDGSFKFFNRSSYGLSYRPLTNLFLFGFFVLFFSVQKKENK